MTSSEQLDNYNRSYHSSAPSNTYEDIRIWEPWWF